MNLDRRPESPNPGGSCWEVLLSRGPVQIALGSCCQGLASLHRMTPSAPARPEVPDKTTRFVFCSFDILFINPQYCRILKRKSQWSNSQAESQKSRIPVKCRALFGLRDRGSGPWTCGWSSVPSKLAKSSAEFADRWAVLAVGSLTYIFGQWPISSFRSVSEASIFLT